MRICMMNDNFYRSSGAAIAIKRISQALTDVDYCVAGCSGEGVAEDLSWVPAGRYECFDLKSSNPTKVIKELSRFRRWFKQNQCDLVHCHHRRLAALLQLARIPVLYTGQVVFEDDLWFRWLAPRRMTATSGSVATNILETTGRKVLARIGNPSRFPERPPRIDLGTVRNRAVCVARLERVKGHTHLLAAWKLLHNRGHRYQLDLVGEGPLRPELESQTRADGTDYLIRFCGFTTDVPGVIDRALFAILASRLEGQPIAALEAAAMGRPCLLTAVPGSIDLLPPGRRLKNGVPFGNVKDLADALEEWFAHPEVVIEEGEVFFHHLKASNDPSRIAREYREVYQQILAEIA